MNVSKNDMIAVLIVEDDRFSQMILKQLFNQHKIKTYSAENGQEAIVLLENNDDISHITLDINMPVMDGYSLLEYINGCKMFDHLKIIVTSCNSQNHFMEETSSRNIDTKLIKGYFEKPFDFTTLVKTIENNL